jgi:probable F420-dependent oxidoreductase
LYGEADGPHFEGWTLLTAMAQLTSRAEIGCLVTCNTYCNPNLLADMARTIDHISNGRLIFGIGAGWFERDYREYGYEFGTAPGRLKDLGQSLPVIRERWQKLNPPPVRNPIPIMIGGGGEKKTLRIVARYADACNVGGGFENVRRKDEILRRHCEEIGRDESEIERTVGIGTCIIRDDPGEAERVFREMFERNGNADLWKDQLVGTVDQVVQRLEPFLGIGFRHFIVGFPSPYDAESMERLMTEVKPALSR